MEDWFLTKVQFSGGMVVLFSTNDAGIMESSFAKKKKKALKHPSHFIKQAFVKQANKNLKRYLLWLIIGKLKLKPQRNITI